MWCDFGANLVQHFMLAYSRYSRYRTKTHDNQTKRVGKLACQRASADCSASVPSKTEHSTKCRRANGGRAKRMPCRRFATDSMHPAVRVHANPSDWIEKKQVFRLAFFLAPPAGLEPATTWLTVRCSTDWAKEDYEKLKVENWKRKIIKSQLFRAYL